MPFCLAPNKESGVAPQARERRRLPSDMGVRGAVRDADRKPLSRQSRRTSACRWTAWFVGVVLASTSCASIPPESVELSRGIGHGIGQSRTAHRATLDAFYQRLKADNDTWVANTYLPDLIRQFKSRLEAACEERGDTSPECSQITEEDIQGLAGKAVEFRDDLQAALEKSRDQAIRLIDDHYADLEAANAAITGLLASAVDVNAATREGAATLAQVTGAEIDLDAIQTTVEEFLERAAGVGAGVSELESLLSGVLKKDAAKSGDEESDP